MNMEPTPPRPSWLECWRLGMTAQQAADARGVNMRAAYQWASYTHSTWANARRGNKNAAGQTRALSPLWHDCHKRGLTARQAMAELGVTSLESAKRWASRFGVVWPPDLDVNTGYPNKVDLPRLPPITDPAELDAEACRRMWACKIGLMLQDLTGTAVVLSQGSRPRAVTKRDRNAARYWFRSRDFDAIASMIGLDPQAVRDRLQQKGAL